MVNFGPFHLSYLVGFSSSYAFFSLLACCCPFLLLGDIDCLRCHKLWNKSNWTSSRLNMLSQLFFCKGDEVICFVCLNHLCFEIYIVILGTTRDG